MLIVFIFGRIGLYCILRKILSMNFNEISFLGWSASFSKSKIKLNQHSVKWYNRLLCNLQCISYFFPICVLLLIYVVDSSFEGLLTNQLSFKSIILAESRNFISFFLKLLFQYRKKFLNVKLHCVLRWNAVESKHL